MRADAVFEGGGVKGIAFVGALAEMEARGYRWERLAGTSAGAIVAALLCAGYSSRELEPVCLRLNFLKLLARKGWRRIPLIGPACALLVRKGLYPTDEFERMMDRLLRRKGICTFGDLPAGKLKIIVSDISAGRMLVLPDDLGEFGLDPARFPIARAVRMSSGIPYVFEPYRLYKGSEVHYIVDGGLLSNFPVWLFDVPGTPRWPTFGFRLTDDRPTVPAIPIRGLYSYTRAIIATMLDAHDRLYVKRAHAVRTVFIPTEGISSLAFDLSLAQRKALIESGREAARRFLSGWDFAAYIREFRDPRRLP